MTAPDADAIWRDLRRAVREAHALGAEFRIVGADIEITGDLPRSLRDALPAELLLDFLGAERADIDAIDFLDAFGVAPVLVTDHVGLDAAIKDLTGADPIAIDIETARGGAMPAPIRINKDGSLAFRQEPPSNTGLDPHQANIEVVTLYGDGEFAYIFRGEALDDLINSSWLREQHLVTHNAAFEITFLQHRSPPPEGARTRHPVECTLQATGLLHGAWRRSLAAAAVTVFAVEPPKSLQTSYWGAPRLSAGQIAYAATDAVLTLHIWQDMHPQIEAKGRLAAYELQRDAIPAVVDMQLRGLGFDPAEHTRQVDAWSRDLAEARRGYLDMTGRPAPTTPAEVRTWLSSVAGDRLANWPRTPTGELSIERKHLKRLALSDEPTIRPVLAMLANEKLISTFGPKLREFINPVTGRIHCSYNIAGTKAGRFSASKPNLQQLPSAKAPAFKSAVIAAPGNVLVGGDWSQIEMRAAAWISGDAALTAVYEEERDLHTETAALIAGVLIDEVTPEQRQSAKPVNFGSIYGIGPRTLAEDAFANYGVDMTEMEARAALDRFFLTYSTLKRWMRDHADLCQRRGYVEIGCGRVVEAAWEPGGRLSFPQCCNLPVQGAAADAMLRALPMVHHRLRGLDGGIVASVHDEILLEVSEAGAEAARQILEETMIEAFALTFPGAPLGKVVDVKIGRTWKEVK